MSLLLALANFIDIKAGLQDYFRAYQATILPVDASIERQSMENAFWQYLANYEIIIYTKRLARDNLDVQLGNVEREIMRIVCMYSYDTIPGVEDMFYRGHERIYGIGDNYAKSNWATRILITIRYHVARGNP